MIYKVYLVVKLKKKSKGFTIYKNIFFTVFDFLLKYLNPNYFKKPFVTSQIVNAKQIKTLIEL
jgi:hypothetical protein